MAQMLVILHLGWLNLLIRRMWRILVLEMIMTSLITLRKMTLVTVA